MQALQLVSHKSGPISAQNANYAAYHWSVPVPGQGKEQY